MGRDEVELEPVRAITIQRNKTHLNSVEVISLYAHYQKSTELFDWGCRGEKHPG